MPLDRYSSLCAKNAKIITSRDKGGKQKHTSYNDSKSDVSHYQIDGVVIKDGNKCDFLVMKDSEPKTAYLIELKGSDLCWAAMQLQSTANALRTALSDYNLCYRIVANKCKTQEIETAEFKKYRMKWGKQLRYGSLSMEDHF